MVKRQRVASPASNKLFIGVNRKSKLAKILYQILVVALVYSKMFNVDGICSLHCLVKVYLLLTFKKFFDQVPVFILVRSEENVKNVQHKRVRSTNSQP